MDLATVDHLLTTTRSVRKRLDFARPVDPAAIARCIEPCIEGRVEQAGVLAQASLYGSILPSAWSLMLALRARGLGSANVWGQRQP